MKEELIGMVAKAIETAEHWQESGWPVRFGYQATEAGSLKAAEALPRNVVIRDEAINYWRQVKLTGHDTAESGKRALEALKNGKPGEADNALYLCQYLEKPFEHQAHTWLPVYEAFKASVSGN